MSYSGVVRIAPPHITVLFLCAVIPSFLLAQETDVPAQSVPPPLSQTGLQVRSVSAYGVYYSSLVPNGGAGFQATSNLPADAGVGGSVAIEWSKLTERSMVSLDYTPSYTGYIRNSDLNALNHVFSLTASRKIKPRWTFGFSLAANLNTFEQSLFSPTTLSNAASVPSTFNDLSAGLLSSKFTNNQQLGTILNSAPLVESPISSLVYGQRMLTSSARVSLSYSYSPRLSLTFSTGASRTQYVSGNQAPTTTNGYLIASTTSGNASMGFSYSLSPITQVGGTVSSTRVSSALYDAYTTTSLFTFGRTVGTRWVLQLHGGAGVSNTAGQAYSASAAVPVQPEPVIGGSLAYKTLSSTFLGSYDRTAADMYGTGATTTSSSVASWHWRYPSSSWWLDSSFSWQQLNGGAFSNVSGWQASIGLSRAVGAHTVFITQYVYLSYSGGVLATTYNTSQSAVRFSVVWTPRPPTFQ